MFCHFKKCIPLLCYLICIVGAYYTQEWAVHIEGGTGTADRIAQRLGFINHGKIFGDYYLFQHHSIKKRSTEPSAVHHSNLLSEPEVSWAEQQIAKVRVKRGNVRYRPYRKGPEYVNWNDPFWDQMWYLNRGAGNDMNVQEAWKEGVTGKGVVVTILDDGLETDHPDIADNYDPEASYDVNGLDADPTPRYDMVNSNRHGTRCAGEVAAIHNNSVCSVGVAYDAKVGGVRMLDGDVTDAVEARSLSLNPNHIDIYSASWGPDDDGKTVDGPGELATQAFQDGVKNGRNGKGSIFIWASGNGGRSHDNCNCDGYTNSIWTLSISSATENGGVPWYSEACSSTLATTYSSGGATEKQIITTDLHHSCTTSHTGTSASAPIAAGIAALALSANKDLTWRDMQHIVVRTARQANLGGDDWATNGVGRKVSHSFGYGLMDAAAMVKLARKWKTVPEQKLCEVQSPHFEKVIPGKSHVTLPLNVTGCSEIQFLEHVQAKVTMSAMRRGDIEIFLDSPSGTRSTLLALRPHDQSKAGFKAWPFMTVHSWGERPQGVWLLEIHNDGHFLTKVSDWKLVVHGTTSEPQPCKNCENISPNNAISDHEVVNTRDYKYRPILGFTSSSCSKLDESGHCLGCSDGSYIFLNHCIAECPTSGFYVTETDKSAACHQCHYSCRSCTGPNDYDCTGCYEDAVLSNRTDNNDNRLRCYPLVLFDDLNNAGYWYVVLVSLFLLLLLLVLVLVSVECYRQCRRSASGQHTKVHPVQYHMLGNDEPKSLKVTNSGPLPPYALSDSDGEVQ